MQAEGHAEVPTSAASRTSRRNHTAGTELLMMASASLARHVPPRLPPRDRAAKD